MDAASLGWVRVPGGGGGSLRGLHDDGLCKPRLRYRLEGCLEGEARGRPASVVVAPASNTAQPVLRHLFGTRAVLTSGGPRSGPDCHLHTSEDVIVHLSLQEG